MARPRKYQDYLVHRITELIRLADGMRENEKLKNALTNGGITFELADGQRLDIYGPDEIARAWRSLTLHRPQNYSRNRGRSA